jgi:hypothetical protein
MVPAEIMQACAGLRAWSSRDCECLCLSSLACLKGLSVGYCVVLRGGSLELHGPGGAKETGQRIGDPMVCGAAALWAYRVGFGLQGWLFS